jgi:hypothetical protein
MEDGKALPPGIRRNEKNRIKENDRGCDGRRSKPHAAAWISKFNVQVHVAPAG